MAPVADKEDIEEDEEVAGDGDDLSGEDFGGRDPFAIDGEEGEDREEYDAAELGVDDENSYEAEEEDDDDDRPIYLNHLVLVPVLLVLAVAGLVTWLTLSFDETAYRETTKPLGMYSPVVAPAQPGPAPQIAEAGAAIPGDEAAVPNGEGVAADGAENAPAAEAPPEAAAPADGVEVAVVEPELPPVPEPVPEPEPEPDPVPEPEPAPAFQPDPQFALAPAPDPGLIAEAEIGPLPVIGEDGRQPWNVYARPVDLPADMPKIAIVIGGLGMSEAATIAAIQQLPGAVTLAFAPYAPNLEAWIADARAAGHEVILQLPMEPMDFPANDPGPQALLTEAEVGENLERLHWLLSRFTGYVGVTNYMGSKLTTSREAMEPILVDLQSRGLMFLDARESVDSIAGDLAAELHMPHAVNNRFLDAVASRVSIDARLFELERIAESTGAAVGIGFPYPVTIERVSEWMDTLEENEIAVVPISALVSVEPIN